MKKLTTIVTLLVAGFALAGCQSASTASSKQQNKTDTTMQVKDARHTLDWKGTYQGVLPCADCEGVATMLVLEPSLEYSLRTRLLGKEDLDKKFEGNFSWQDDAHISLLPENGALQVYRVHEGFLELALPDGGRVPVQNIESYRLYKTN